MGFLVWTPNYAKLPELMARREQHVPTSPLKWLESSIGALEHSPPRYRSPSAEPLFYRLWTHADDSHAPRMDNEEGRPL